MQTAQNIRMFPPPRAEMHIYVNATLLYHSVASASHYWSVMFPAPGPNSLTLCVCVCVCV